MTDPDICHYLSPTKSLRAPRQYTLKFIKREIRCAKEQY